MSSGQIEIDPRYPSGSWTGFYTHGRRRWPVSQQLSFIKGVIRGFGIDTIGPFVIDGNYDLGSGKTSWLKQYVDQHVVNYIGVSEANAGLWGFWALDGQLGEYHFACQPDVRCESLEYDIAELARLTRELASRGWSAEARLACQCVMSNTRHAEPSSLNSAAWVLYESGFTDHAERLVRESLVADANDTFAIHTLIAILIRKRDWSSTWKLLAKWLETVPGHLVHDRWSHFYLLDFRQLAHEGQVGTVTTVMEAVNRKLWQPLHNAFQVLDNPDHEIPSQLRESTLALVEQLLGGVANGYPGVANQDEADGAVHELKGTVVRGSVGRHATLTLCIVNSELNGEISFADYDQPSILRIQGGIAGIDVEAETYDHDEHWSDWRGIFDAEAGQFIGFVHPVSPRADQQRETLVFDRGNYSPLEDSRNLTGRWLGFYEQFGERYAMEMDLECERGKVTGNGSDQIGPFQIQGVHNDYGHIQWKKMYIGQHDVEYCGIISDSVIRGGWFLSGALGSFELRRE